MTPTRNHYEEARIVLTRPDLFSERYVKTCQKFRDQWGTESRPKTPANDNPCVSCGDELFAYTIGGTTKAVCHSCGTIQEF